MATIRFPNVSASDVPPNLAALSIGDFDVADLADDRIEFESENDNVRFVIEGNFEFDPEIFQDPDNARHVIQNTNGELVDMRVSNLGEDITLLALVDADADFDDVRSLLLDGHLDQAMTLTASLSSGTSVIDGADVPVGFELDLRPGADNVINGVPLGIAAGAAIDAAIGSVQDDTIIGNGADNALPGGAGNDTLQGKGGNDLLTGSAGDDVLSGRAGDDTLEGNSGDDTLAGGKGNDALRGLDDNDTLIGGQGGDLIEGGAGDDALTGDGGADTLQGGPGADQLQGGAGDDVLSGNKGNDAIEGGAGSDTLSGGLGADTFVYASADEGVDTITDFEDGDVIDLSEVLNVAPEDDLAGFVTIADETLQVDPEGAANLTDLVTVSGGFGGATVEQLVADGTLVVS